MSPRPSPPPTEAIARALAEFGLGEPLAVRALEGGISVPYHVTTDAGEFVLHAAADVREAALYCDVVRRLEAARVRQASPLETPDGRLVSSEGWRAQEHLRGAWVLRPDAAQSLAWAAYLARYHGAIAEVPIPGWLSVPDNAWRRADAIELQLGELRDETMANEPFDKVRRAYDRCVERILEGRPYLDARRARSASSMPGPPGMC